MISSFITSYGYLAVFLGTIAEGETILIAAGFAAHRGLLDWRVVAMVAALGGTLGDQAAFLLGRWKGDAIFARFPALARHRPRVRELLERHAVTFILLVRFLYGLRIAGPVILGTTRLSLAKFAMLNLIGAVIWASLVTAAGYAFGVALSLLVADMKRVEEAILLALIVGGAGIMLWRRWRAARAHRGKKGAT